MPRRTLSPAVRGLAEAARKVPNSVFKVALASRKTFDLGGIPIRFADKIGYETIGRFTVNGPGFADLFNVAIPQDCQLGSEAESFLFDRA